MQVQRAAGAGNAGQQGLCCGGLTHVDVCSEVTGIDVSYCEWGKSWLGEWRREARAQLQHSAGGAGQ